MPENLNATLFIDADDTLWENNIYFEAAFSAFVEILGHSCMSPEEVRASLDEIENVNNKIHGYGSSNFVRNLRECLHHLAERGVSAADLHRLAEIERDLLHHPLVLIEDVEETLAWLEPRHRLVICTKGDYAEQSRKIQTSGLAKYFHEVEILSEKDPGQYRALMASRKIGGDKAWMVGNSPKSDINASLEAGMGAVYVPHPHTWHLEQQHVPSGHPKLITLQGFGELRQYF
jgi:putative hydrolase of the HAD superfamily